jgi:cyclic beta-1,2-glucan synthetase
VDIARTLTAERGDGEDSDVLVWAQATRATIASHRRDLERLMPWASSHLEAVIADLPTASRAAAIASSALCSSFPTLAALADLCESAGSELTAMLDDGPRAGSVRGDRVERVHELIGQLEGAAVASRGLVERLSAVARITKQLFDAMEFGFLFHSARKIFSIGYRVTEGSLDPSAYDLLASEARLASFIAIANGGAPTSHWFHLVR